VDNNKMIWKKANNFVRDGWSRNIAGNLGEAHLVSDALYIDPLKSPVR